MALSGFPNWMVVPRSVSSLERNLSTRGSIITSLVLYVFFFFFGVKLSTICMLYANFFYFNVKITNYFIMFL